MKTIIRFTLILSCLFISQNALAQIREHASSATQNLSAITLLELQNPSMQNLSVPEKNSKNRKTQGNNWISSPVAKTFLKIGVDMIRGENENYPLCSLDNAWKYPGPTVRYPETVTEYEAFLNRISRFNPDYK